jgi:hypothetical protein
MQASLVPEGDFQRRVMPAGLQLVFQAFVRDDEIGYFVHVASLK